VRLFRVIAVVEIAIVIWLGYHLRSYANSDLASLTVGGAADIIICVLAVFLLVNQAMKFWRMH
jgi:hypothetical protein